MLTCLIVSSHVIDCTGPICVVTIVTKSKVVVSPLVTNNQPDIKVGDAAQRAELGKIEKHGLACEAAGYGFRAFAMDVFGVLGKESKLLLNRVIEKMSRETCCARYKAQAICQRRISLALQLGVSRQLLASREVADPPESGVT